MLHARHISGLRTPPRQHRMHDRERKAILDFAEKDGSFGVEKEEWMRYLENGEYLRTTEIDTEQNYDIIDGRRNNMEPEKKETPIRGKESFLERLKEMQPPLNASARKEDKEKRWSAFCRKTILGTRQCRKAKSCPTKNFEFLKNSIVTRSLLR